MKRYWIIGIIAAVVCLGGIGGGLWWLYNNSGGRLLTRAALAAEVGKFDKALGFAAKYIADRPREWRGYYMRGKILCQSGQYDAARDSLAQAEGLAPEEASIRVLMRETHAVPGRKALASKDLAGVREGVAELQQAAEVLSSAQVTDPKQALDIHQHAALAGIELGHALQVLRLRLTDEAVVSEAKRDLAARDAFRAEAAEVGDQATKALDEGTQALLSVVTRDASRADAATALIQVCLERQDQGTLAAARQAVMGMDDPSPVAAMMLVMNDVQTVARQEGPGPVNRERVAAALTLLDQINERHPDNVPVKLARVELASRLSDFETAQRLCEEVLKADARNPRARLRQGELLAARGNLAEAEKKLAALKNDVPQWPDVQLVYARVALRMGNTQGAAACLSALTKAAPKEISTRLQVAQLAMALGDLATVKRLSDEVLTEEPGNAWGHLIRGMLLAQSGNVGGAEKVLSALKTQSPQWADAQLTYARVAAQAGDLTNAALAAEAVVQLDPKDAEAVRLLADLQLRQGKYEAALELARAAHQLRSDDPAGLRLFVDAAVRNNQADAAREALGKAVAESPSKPEMLMAAAEGYLALKDNVSATEAMKSAASCAPATPVARAAVAQALVRLDRVTEAERLLTDELKKDPNQAALHHQLGQIYAASGRVLPAIDQFRQAADLQKDAAEYRLTLARALLDIGDVGECRAVLDSMDSSDPTANTLRLQARLIQGEPVNVEQMLGQVQAGTRSSLAVALPYLASGQVKQCIAFCEEELKKSPGDLELRLLLGRALLMSGQQERGVQQWEQVLQAAPDRLSTYLELASVLSAANSAGQVAQRMAGVAGARQDMVDLAVGNMLVASGGSSEAIPVLSALANRAEAPEHVRGRAALLLAQALAETGQVEKAAAEFDRLKANPAWKRMAILGKAQLLAAAQRLEPADAALAELRQAATEAQDAAMLRNVAELYARMRQTDKALAVCDQLLQLQPDDSRTCMVRAAVLETAGKGAEAIEYYRKAIDLQPGNFALYVTLARSLDAQGRSVEALEVLRGLEEAGPAAVSVATFQRGALLAQWGLADQAAECFAKLANTEYGGVPQVRLALGRSFAELGQTDKAKELLTGVPAFAAEYVPARLLLARMAPAPDARLAIIRQVQQNHPGRPDLLLEEMLVLVQDGKHAEAVKAFRSFVAQHAQARALPETAAYLAVQAMLETQDASGAREIALRLSGETNQSRWRDLAILLAMDDDPKSAAALLPETDKADPSACLLGFCLARQGKDNAAAARWAERFAAQPGEAIRRDPSVVAGYRLLLALALGRADGAKAELPGITDVLGFGRTPARELLSSAGGAGASEEAFRLLKAHAALDAGAPTVALALARVALSDRPTCQWAAALAIRSTADPKIQKQIADLCQPKDSPVAILHEAQVLARQRDFAGAARQFGLALQADDCPGLAMNQAINLEYAGRFDQALAIYRKVWQDAGLPDAANNAAYVLLELHPGDPATLTEAMDLVEKALAARPGHPSYLDTRGWAAYLQGRHEQACTDLRKAARADAASPQVHYHLGLAEAACGRLDLARWHHAAAINLAGAAAGGGGQAPAEVARIMGLSEQALGALGPAK